MKVAVDSSPKFDERPFAFAPGESPVDGYTVCAGLRNGDLGETYLAENAGGRRLVLRRVANGANVGKAGLKQSRGRKTSHLVETRDAIRASTGETWLVRDYVSGWSLADVLAARDGRMALKDARRWVKGIAAGLRELADGGAVHGRLKPSNVWLERGVVKLVDGGLPPATWARESGGANNAARYAAPETAAGRFDKADLYALGAMLVEMLAGRPFDAHDDWPTWLAEPYRPILARALDPDPSRRWATVDELLAALEAAPQSLPPPVLDAPQTAPADRDTPGRVLWCALGVCLMILAIALSMTPWFR